MELTEKLAREFSRILHDWLKPSELQEVNEKNATEEYTGLCATHDYCDSNVAMIEAFKLVTGFDMQIGESEDPDVQKEIDADFNLSNKAWDLAKQNQFYTNEKA